MKKVLTIISIVLLLLCSGLSTFAASGSFTASPSAKQAPELVDSENTAEPCDAAVKVVAYAERDTLDAQAKTKLEAAYKDIASTNDLGTLGYDVKALANSLNYSSDQFFVSDLFAIDYTDCDAHTAHQFDVTIEPVSTKNYVGILRYANGVWMLVDAVCENGEISFSMDDPSPFAIVVHDGSVNAGNQNGSFSDGEMKILAISLVCISLIGIGVIVNKLQKS